MTSTDRIAAVRHVLPEISASDWYALFAQHLAWARGNNRISGSPQWDADGLNVIGVRMNPLTDFYVKGKNEFNDYLFLVMNGEVTAFPCTTDPAHVHENPKGIAHLDEGCWDAYVRGLHKGRKALIQRTNPVRVTRTNDAGVINVFDWGYFGINIHNAAGFRKPSAGCTVIKPERGLMLNDKAYARFREIIAAAPDRPSRTYCLMNAEQFAEYVGLRSASL